VNTSITFKIIVIVKNLLERLNGYRKNGLLTATVKNPEQALLSI
jgi:hypothetical protein